MWASEGLSGITNLTLLPYGNAHVVGGKVTCQHGDGECQGNRWEQCAIHHYPDPVQHFPFYLCMEKLGEAMLTGVQGCATQANMSYPTLQKCWGTATVPSAESAMLQKSFGDRTPTHKYTPWVLVNNVWLDISKAGNDIKKATCAAWVAAGGKSPAGCASFDAPRTTPRADLCKVQN